MTESDNTQPSAAQTVYIVEDDAAVGEALCDLFDSAGVAAQHFPTAEAFLAFWNPSMAGCLMLDVRLPGMSGIELQSDLAETGHSIPIIIMTAHGDVPMVRKAFKAGAVEFLTKPFQDEELLGAVRSALALDRERRATALEAGSVRMLVDSLSKREREVVEMVTAGITNREIAEKLYLSQVTIKLYRRQAMEKLRVETLADLVKLWQKR
jgi:FixJ family two-component response regulator